MDEYWSMNTGPFFTDSESEEDDFWCIEHTKLSSQHHTEKVEHQRSVGWLSVRNDTSALKPQPRGKLMGHMWHQPDEQPPFPPQKASDTWLWSLLLEFSSLKKHFIQFFFQAH